MTHEAKLAERMDHLEAQVAPLADTAKALSELREELAPRVSEAVQALILELADVEPDFQIEDLVYLIKNIMRNVKNLNFTLDQLKNLIDFMVIAEPLFKTTIPQFIQYADDLERAGVFRLLSTGMDVLRKVGSTYSAEQLNHVGDGLVRLVGSLHKLTSPESLDLLDKAAGMPSKIDLSGTKPIGAMGLVGTLADPKVKEGLGVAMALTRALSGLKA